MQKISVQSVLQILDFIVPFYVFKETIFLNDYGSILFKNFFIRLLVEWLLPFILVDDMDENFARSLKAGPWFVTFVDFQIMFNCVLNVNSGI